MLGNALMKVCNCTENDALSLAFDLYQLCADINDFESHEECQILYNALVNRLNLVNHADAVLNANTDVSIIFVLYGVQSNSSQN